MYRKYFAERKGEVKNCNIDFDKLIRLFRNKIDLLVNELYFQEATGYYCTDDGQVIGKWGTDIDIFIFDKTKYEDVWPIASYYESYDENILFTMIEFLFDYVSEPINKYYHDWNNCGWHCSKFDKKKGQEKFRKEINDIISRYNQGYTLTEEGAVHLLPPSGLKELVEEKVETDDKDNIDYRINNAISQYFRFNSTLADKKAAILNLAGILEYLKTKGSCLDGADSNDLFQIMNKFDLRHHQKTQQTDYAKEEWYEWFFYTFLSSIRLLLKLSK